MPKISIHRELQEPLFIQKLTAKPLNRAPSMERQMAHEIKIEFLVQLQAWSGIHLST